MKKPRFRCEFSVKGEYLYVFAKRFHDLKDGFWLDHFHDHEISAPIDGNIWIPPAAIRYIQRER